ncbi:MAG: ISAs1 family transposase, partial [Flavobacteriales bacterium]
MDAIYCQKDISRQIIAAKADYVLALKQNHKTLYEDVSLWLDTQAAQHSQDVIEEVNKDHGRIETRRYYLNTEIAWLSRFVSSGGVEPTARQ